MTVEEFRGAVTCKLEGTLHLHNISLELGLALEFFTLLSSISGIYGSKGQANYAAANAFLDAFASYRSGTLGLPTSSIDLGVIEDVGYMAEHEELQHRYDQNVWHPINDKLLRKIFEFSIMGLDVQEQPAWSSMSHMITGIQVPQPRESPLLSDARFSHLDSGAISAGDASIQHEGNNLGARAVLVMAKSNTQRRAILDATADVLNKFLRKGLRLNHDLNINRPLSAYGIDSLAAVEFRNFIKSEFGVEVTTLEVVNAPTLTMICDKIVEKIAMP